MTGRQQRCSKKCRRDHALALDAYRAVRTGRGKTGSAISAHTLAIAHTAGHEVAASSGGMASGVTNRVMNAHVLPIASAVPARRVPASVASSV